MSIIFKSEDKENLLKCALEEGIGVNLSSYPPSRMAEELSDNLLSFCSCKTIKRGNSLDLIKDKRHIGSISVDKMGILFFGGTIADMKEPMVYIIKHLVSKTFN